MTDEEYLAELWSDMTVEAFARGLDPSISMTNHAMRLEIEKVMDLRVLVFDLEELIARGPC